MTPATTHADPLARSLQRVWAGLPDEPLGERDLEERILEITNHGEGDFAWAAAVRHQLVSAGAVIVRQGEKPGELLYQRADAFPEVPSDTGYGSGPFNDELRRVSEREQEQLRALDEQRRREFENSPWATERRQIIDLVAQETAPLRAEVARLRAEVAALRALHTDDEDDAA